VLTVAFVAGMARSGTSWLGEILNSSPTVRYCFQPLFSYAYKGRVSYETSRDELQRFFADLYESADLFLRQQERRDSGLYPTFVKCESPSHLVFKENRYQYLIPCLLDRAPNLKLVSIVRHPCGALLSWLRNPKEFPPDADSRSEWRFGACKNLGREENFFGYFKWKETAHLYLDMRDKFPSRAMVVRYEDLVRRPLEEAGNVFQFLGLEVGEQTQKFVTSCHDTHLDSPYAVFKHRSVADRWRTELDAAIRDEVLGDLAGTRLACFMEE
jgi:hypothetical protein